jgi:hypothetical protein
VSGLAVWECWLRPQSAAAARNGSRQSAPGSSVVYMKSLHGCGTYRMVLIYSMRRTMAPPRPLRSVGSIGRDGLVGLEIRCHRVWRSGLVPVSLAGEASEASPRFPRRTIFNPAPRQRSRSDLDGRPISVALTLTAVRRPPRRPHQPSAPDLERNKVRGTPPPPGAAKQSRRPRFGQRRDRHGACRRLAMHDSGGVSSRRGSATPVGTKMKPAARAPYRRLRENGAQGKRSNIFSPGFPLTPEQRRFLRESIPLDSYSVGHSARSITSAQ